MEELLKLTNDPFLNEQCTTEAFVGIVANFLEHFESQKEILESFSIINGPHLPSTPLSAQSNVTGDAIAHASRAPSLTTLASEEQAIWSDSRSSGITTSPISTSSRRPSKTQELPATFPGSSPLLSKEHLRRLGSFDGSHEPVSPHRSLCRAFSLATFQGNSERIDGFPYLSFSPGQVKPVSCMRLCG